MPGFEELHHTADAALRVWGETIPALFSAAAEGMFALMGVPETVETKRAVELAADDLEGLLVDWLNELLYLRDRHKELYVRFEVNVEPSWFLRAEVWGGRGIPQGPIIKAATYHGLVIRKSERGFEAEIVFDT